MFLCSMSYCSNTPSHINYFPSHVTRVYVVFGFKGSPCDCIGFKGQEAQGVQPEGFVDFVLVQG